MAETTLTDGSPVTPDHKEIDPKTGQQKGYVVLSEAERAKGFIRPVRQSYVHLGNGGAKYPLRDLTQEEKEQLLKYAPYVKYEEYPESELPKCGRYWTQEDLDRAKCGAKTTMALPLAETYARNPKFYGSTFCCGCGSHYPVSEFVWDGTEEIVGS